MTRTWNLSRRLAVLIALALLLALAASPATSKESDAQGPTTISDTQHYTLKAAHIDQVFGIDVYRPRVEGPLPVVYCLDGNSTFAMAAQIVGPLVYAGELPPVLLVGIGYEVENVYDVMHLRARDLTPTASQAFVEEAAAQGTPLPAGIRPGGADAFLRFLEEEVKPFIAARYEVKADDETLVGDSFGGLFVLHTLFTAPESFERYVAGSPTISWDDGKLLKDETALATRVKDLPVKLFLSAGALEEPQMLVDLTRMARSLSARSYPGLALTHHVFDDETHVSVIAPTLSRGLRAVFGALTRP